VREQGRGRERTREGEGELGSEREQGWLSPRRRSSRWALDAYWSSLSLSSWALVIGRGRSSTVVVGCR
jgi:hypothetical protein